jgi:hypothetical protein
MPHIDYGFLGNPAVTPRAARRELKVLSAQLSSNGRSSTLGVLFLRLFCTRLIAD